LTVNSEGTMKKSTQPTLQSDSSTAQQHIDNYLPQCVLKWRQGQLLVSLGQEGNQPYISAFESEQQLVECLKHSPARLVHLDLTLGEVALQRWADACKQANKSVFLRRTVARKLSKMPRRQSQFSQQFKQLIYWVVAFLLLIVLSPVMAATAILMCIYSPGPIFSKQWHISPRGKLFQLPKFRTTVVNDDFRSTSLVRWMCKYNVDELPQLLNVLRGEISLMNPHPLTLSEAVRFGLKCQQQLSTVLEIAEAQMMGNDSNEFDLVTYKH
jgi:lipopolysaccharide/colanic/teichoic acid biosynthesis glycosyltransferase